MYVMNRNFILSGLPPGYIILSRSDDSFGKKEDDQNKQNSKDKKPAFHDRMQKMRTGKKAFGEILKIGQERMRKL